MTLIYFLNNGMMQRHVPAGGADGSGEIILFGVRVKVDPMRKSVSMNNLSEYHHPNNNNNELTTNETAAAAADVSLAVVASGYASADDVAHRHSPAARPRKRGVPWTEEEHKLFLLGLQKVGKGDWRGISRNYVKTRTPTQVASHAQKYFLRKSNLNRRRRRSSLFDITTDWVSANPMEEDNDHQENVIQPGLKSPAPSTAADFSQKLTKDDPTLSLNLSLSFDHHNQLSSRQSGYQVARNLSNGDGMICVV